MDPFEAKWQRMYGALKAYKEDHGNCRIPQVYKPNPQLAWWVVSQRRSHSKQQLSADRIRCLDTIGFEWNPVANYVSGKTDTAWDKKCEEFCAFRNEHGHCNVPLPFATNPSLGIWVETQCLQWRAGKLSEARIRRLTEIGFRWDSVGKQ